MVLGFSYPGSDGNGGKTVAALFKTPTHTKIHQHTKNWPSQWLETKIVLYFQS